ncbi:MAG: glutamyl-tRNA reductase [Opitutaceae bacterium]|nr:glutamyl-tRNA reductase [Opitutaceae bacterium]
MSHFPPDATGLFVFGATHRTTPIEVREKLSLPAPTAEHLHADLARIAGLREYAVLNTCNRIEFYGVADTPDAAAKVQAAFCQRQQFAEEEFAKYRTSLNGPAAVQHLFEVAAGIDSQLVGETEILGQVKGAYAAAQARRSTGPVLNRVFQKTFQAAKHVRSSTAITEGQVSIANVAVELAYNIFGRLEATRVLLLGAGDIGEKTAKAFRSRGAGSLTVSSRSMERAMALASELDAQALPFEHRAEHLAQFDVVVCSTSAPEAVVLAADVRTAMRGRASRPLFLIDLALPRDVEAEVSKLENVYLYNLDDLAKIAEENRAAREAEIAKCRQIINERASALWKQVESQVTGGPNRTAPPIQPDQEAR